MSKRGFFARGRVDMDNFGFLFYAGYTRRYREASVIFGFPFWTVEIGWRF